MRENNTKLLHSELFPPKNLYFRKNLSTINKYAKKAYLRKEIQHGHQKNRTKNS